MNGRVGSVVLAVGLVGAGLVGCAGRELPAARPPAAPDPAPAAAALEALASFPTVLVRFLPAGLEWCLLLADNAARRTQGLMGVRELHGYAGMLFRFDGEVGGPFWMRKTPRPLSIAWFDRSGSFVSSADMAPCGDRPSCPTYPAARRYRWALEVPQGGLDAIGARPGSRLVEVAPVCRPSG